MKKRLMKVFAVSIAVVILVTSALFVTNALNEPAFVLSAVQGAAGEEVSVSLSLRNNPGITALSVNVAYPTEDYDLIAVENAGLFENPVTTSRLSQNPVTISWYAADSGNKSNSGNLAILRFKIKDGAKSGDITLSYDEDNVFDNRMENVRFEVENGGITVGAPQPTGAFETQSSAPADSPAFCLGSARGVKGEEVELPLVLTNNPGITALSVNVAYSSKDLELIAVDNEALFENPVTTSRLSQNPITISWYAADSQNKTSDGVLALLRFKVRENAETSSVTLSYDADNVFDNTFQNIEFSVENGTITIETEKESVIGDADGDGEVTSIDVTLIQRRIADMDVPYSDDILMNGDADGNGVLEITDATWIQRYLAEFDVPYPIGEAMTK